MAPNRGRSRISVGDRFWVQDLEFWGLGQLGYDIERRFYDLRLQDVLFVFSVQDHRLRSNGLGSGVYGL